MGTGSLSAKRGRSRLRRACDIGLLLLALTVVGCKRSDDGSAPRAKELPALTLRDETPDLLLTYVDEKGNFFTAQRIDEVPIDKRDVVRVVVTTQDDGVVSDLVYVANLTQKRADGTYVVNTMTRAEWEGVARKRRGEAPSAGSSESPSQRAPSGKIVAHVYGAEWCGPCHDAQAFLRKRGAQVVYHDVEAEPGAQQEMAKKLARAGVRGGSIPVIDIAGRMLVGFSAQAVDAALAAAGQPAGVQPGGTLL